MTDKPIIFPGPMVRAILDGRKTQTRRVLKPQPHFSNLWRDECSGDWWQSGHGEAGDDLLSLPYAPGDRLWVRESVGRRPASFLGIQATNGVEEAFYCADGEDVVDPCEFNICPWWPRKKTLRSIHMPRWASRLTLTVTGVRVERVQDISDDDCEAEGAFSGHDWDCTTGCEPSAPFHPDQKCRCGDSSYQEVFARLWDSINGDRKDKAGNRLPYAWADNPWVVAVTFETRRRNIDAMERA